MALKKWDELSVELRRSERKRWNYLVEELNGDSSEESEEP